MNPAKVVVHVMERNRVLQILQLFTERIGQSRESTDRHSHRQILALNVAGGYVIIVGIAADDRFARSHAHSGTVTCFQPVRRVAVNLLQHRKVNFFPERILNRFQVRAMAIGRELHAISEACFQVLDEMMSSACMATPNEPARHKFGIRVKRNPSPNVSRSFHLLLDVAILLFCINEGPNLITLDALTFQIHENLVLIFRASAAKIAEKFDDGIFGNPRHSNSSANAVALDQTGNNRRPFLGAQFVHVPIMLDRSSIVNRLFCGK